jgi:hypothetical protein
MANRIQLRRDTTHNWESINPILADGEPGYDIVTNEIRIGNGSNVWSELSANTISGGGGTSTGNTLVNGSYTVGLGTDGILTLPFGSTINDTPNAPGSGNGKAVEIKPGGVIYGNQLLRIYATVPTPDANHLHLTSGDLSFTDLFLGNDDQFVQIATDGKVCIGTYGTSGNIWQFGTDGSLAFPNGLNNAHSEIYTTNGGYQTIFETFAVKGHGQKLTLDYDAASVQIQSTVGQVWSFDQSGNLTLPAGGVIVNSDSSVYGAISTSSSVSTYTHSDVSGDYDYSLLAYNYTVNGNGGGFTIAYSAPLVFGNVDISVANVNVAGNLILSSTSQIQSAAGVGNVTVEANNGNNARVWTFKSIATLNLPSFGSTPGAGDGAVGDLCRNGDVLYFKNSTGWKTVGLS